MAYSVPGRADDLSDALVARWNETVTREYTSSFSDHGSRFVTSDPASLSDPQPVPVKWFANPAEPVACLDRAAARRLADWRRGRAKIQDEYAEYAIEMRPDGSGRMRAKRVQVTTELAAYWLTVAAADPEALADMAEDALGRRPTWFELYGLEDPLALDEPARAAACASQLGGGENEPLGDLNSANALFMTNAINGLDDLIFIVMFGARPYKVRLQDGSRRDATADEIFASGGASVLSCRQADPVAAMSAYAAALAGQTVAFADPLGTYVQSLNDQALSISGDSLPSEWIRWGRGEDGMRQRLVVGPSDDDDEFLDDITVSTGAADEPLVGGYQLLELIEVGPLVVRGATTPVEESEFLDVPRLEASVDCAGAAVCGPILELHALMESEGGPRTGQRTLADPGG